MIDLIEVCRINDTEIVKILIDVTNLDLQDIGGWTALMWTCMTRNTKLALKLMDKGAKLDILLYCGCVCVIIQKQSVIFLSIYHKK